MTDFHAFHAMTDQELNEWIFKAKGWERLPFPALPEWQRPSNTPGVNGKFIECLYEPVPDYCNDWKWAGELLEEMVQKFNLTVMRIFSVDHFENEVFIVADVLRCNWMKYVKLPRAISEAYAVMTETIGMTKKESEG